MWDMSGGRSGGNRLTCPHATLSFMRLRGAPAAPAGHTWADSCTVILANPSWQGACAHKSSRVMEPPPPHGERPPSTRCPSSPGSPARCARPSAAGRCWVGGRWDGAGACRHGRSRLERVAAPLGAAVGVLRAPHLHLGASRGHRRPFLAAGWRVSPGLTNSEIPRNLWAPFLQRP